MNKKDLEVLFPIPLFHFVISHYDYGFVCL